MILFPSICSWILYCLYSCPAPPGLLSWCGCPLLSSWPSVLSFCPVLYCGFHPRQIRGLFPTGYQPEATICPAMVSYTYRCPIKYLDAQPVFTWERLSPMKTDCPPARSDPRRSSRVPSSWPSAALPGVFLDPDVLPYVHCRAPRTARPRASQAILPFVGPRLDIAEHPGHTVPNTSRGGTRHGPIAHTRPGSPTRRPAEGHRGFAGIFTPR